MGKGEVCGGEWVRVCSSKCQEGPSTRLARSGEGPEGERGSRRTFLLSFS